MREDLETLLRREIERGVLDVSGRIQLSTDKDGKQVVHLYFHPTDKSGLTVDLVFRGNSIAELNS